MHLRTFIAMLWSGNVHVFGGVLKREVQETTQFCIGDLLTHTFFILTHPYLEVMKTKWFYCRVRLKVTRISYKVTRIRYEVIRTRLFTCGHANGWDEKHCSIKCVI